MSGQEPPTVQLKPIISYPREAQVGKTYLVSIDVQLATPNASWDFPEEEYTIGFILNTSPYFTCEPLHNVWPTIILHRYGGTYGPAEFLLTAAEHEIERGQISITLVNGWGIPMTRLELPCEVGLESEVPEGYLEFPLPSRQEIVEPSIEPIPLSPKEQEERERLDRMAVMLTEAGWIVVDIRGAVAPTTTYTAIRIHPYGGGIEHHNGDLEYHDIDFLLLVNGEAVGSIIREETEVSSSVVDLVDGLINRSKNPFWSSLTRSVREPLPFLYVMQGEEIRFTNNLEPEARTRTVFHFHRPETFASWLDQAPLGTPNDLNDLLRSRLRRMPSIVETDVPADQIEAITKLEASLAENRPRALLQVKNNTPMIINSIYRLLAYGGAKHILYLVDSSEDTEKILNSFREYIIPDTNQHFTDTYILNGFSLNSETNELWVLGSSDRLSDISIMNIDYIYYTLSHPRLAANSLDNSAQINAPIEYQPELPIEFFDVIFFVECFDEIHRRYRPLLDYFDAFLVGVGANIPAHVETLFNRNLVYKQRDLIFICYSHVDREYLERLYLHLKGFTHVSSLNTVIWDDTRIVAGENWHEEITKALQSTKVAILLVSADFLASSYIREVELPVLIQGGYNNSIEILSVIVSPCPFEHTPISQFRSFNNPATPLADMSLAQREETWSNVAEAVWKVIDTSRYPKEEKIIGPVDPRWGTLNQDMDNIERHRVLISYSHKDKAYLERLQVHLMGYNYASSTPLDIDIWDDTKAPQDEAQPEEIEKSLQTTKIAILLVDADFLASDFIREVELPLLLNAAIQNNITILPVVINHCAYTRTPLAQFQPFNNPTTPLAAMLPTQQEDIWSKVAEFTWKTISTES